MSRARRRKGRRVLYIGPEIPDDASPALKNALALRQEANLTGRCPSCGATFEVVAGSVPGLWHGVMEHEDGCPVLLTEAER